MRLLKAVLRLALTHTDNKLKLPGITNYLSALLDQSTPAFLKFGLFLPLASHRSVLSRDAYYAARIAATQHQDCGSCLQYQIAQARHEGVEVNMLRSFLRKDVKDLPAETADVYHFAHAVASQSPEIDTLREAVRGHWGQKGLAEVALAISSAQVFPIMKRALGYAQSCSQVHIEL